jgi:FK506-binding protein 6
MDDVDKVDGELQNVHLREAFNLRRLLDTTGATFEVDTSNENFEDDSVYYDKEELLKCAKHDYVIPDSDEDDAELGSFSTPFQKIASKMINLTEDGKVKKKLIRAGSGCIVPENTVVTVHYNAYVEYGDEPYDSTWLRGFPVVCHLHQGFIPGLSVGISSMKKGETSRFLIHPDMAFRKMGCPPRIPPNAELLFEVQLVNFEDNSVAEALQNLSMDDRKNFNTILKAAQVEHLAGNQLFKKDEISGAIRKYRKAVSILENCHLQDGEDEAKQQSMLLKLYINLAVCYNKQKEPKRACVMCRHALYIQPRNAKALFNSGRALLMLSDYDQAKRRLIAAQRIEPNNVSISSELKKLENKRKAYEGDTRMFSQRMFGGASREDDEPSSKKCVVSADFRKSSREYLTEFANDSGKVKMPLPPGLTSQEEFCIRGICQELGLTFYSRERWGEKLVYVSKSQTE